MSEKYKLKKQKQKGGNCTALVPAQAVVELLAQLKDTLMLASRIDTGLIHVDVTAPTSWGSLAA